MTAEERKEAEIYIAAQIGENPTRDQLLELCVRSHAKRRRLEHGLDTFNRWFKIVCKRGDFAQRQNVEYLDRKFEEFVSGDVSDHLYLLADIREMLRAFELHPSDATIKRWIRKAHQAEIIGVPDDDQTSERRWTKLSRDELLAFIRWKVPSA